MLPIKTHSIKFLCPFSQRLVTKGEEESRKPLYLWSNRWDSNLRPFGLQSNALSTWPQCNFGSVNIELRYCYIHILEIVFVLHHPALSDGCPVADLIQLGDQISSCNSNPFIDWPAVQLVVSHQLSISVPQLLGPEITAAQHQVCYAFWSV